MYIYIYAYYRPSLLVAAVYCVSCRSTCLWFTDLPSEEIHQAHLWVKRAGTLIGIRRFQRHKRYPALSTPSRQTGEQRLSCWFRTFPSWTLQQHTSYLALSTTRSTYPAGCTRHAYYFFAVFNAPRALFSPSVTLRSSFPPAIRLSWAWRRCWLRFPPASALGTLTKPKRTSLRPAGTCATSGTPWTSST